MTCEVGEEYKDLLRDRHNHVSEGPPHVLSPKYAHRIQRARLRYVNCNCDTCVQEEVMFRLEGKRRAHWLKADNALEEALGPVEF